jgi:hypothetical protein
LGFVLYPQEAARRGGGGGEAESVYNVPRVRVRRPHKQTGAGPWRWVWVPSLVGGTDAPPPHDPVRVAAAHDFLLPSTRVVAGWDEPKPGSGPGQGLCARGAVWNWDPCFSWLCAQLRVALKGAGAGGDRIHSYVPFTESTTVLELKQLIVVSGATAGSGVVGRCCNGWGWRLGGGGGWFAGLPTLRMRARLAPEPSSRFPQSQPCCTHSRTAGE